MVATRHKQRKGVRPREAKAVRAFELRRQQGVLHYSVRCFERPAAQSLVRRVNPVEERSAVIDTPVHLAFGLLPHAYSLS
jgi:hypothetical protein